MTCPFAAHSRKCRSVLNLEAIFRINRHGVLIDWLPARGGNEWYRDVTQQKRFIHSFLFFGCHLAARIVGLGARVDGAFYLIAFRRGGYASRRSFLELAPIRRTALETTDDELEHEPPTTPYSAVSLLWSQ